MASSAKTKTPPPAVILSIAGSDNSAGAGAQADLKTISALGAYAVTAITCVVAEVPGKVSAIHPITPEIVAEQIRLLFQSFPIAAVKTGLLHSNEVISCVADILERNFAKSPSKLALVVDPVMVASSGDPLLQSGAIALYRQRLFPIASLITPNLDETIALLGRSITSLSELREAGKELVSTFGVPFLLKGGHLRSPTATDLLFTGDEVLEFSAPFVTGVSTHGTGCTYSAAIATGLGQGLSLPESVGRSKQFLTNAVSQFLRWNHHGQTTDALHHFAPGFDSPAAKIAT